MVVADRVDTETGEVLDGEAPRKRVELVLFPGEEFTARKCSLCEGKCPPHPAVMHVNRPLGDLELTLCARCDVAVTKLAALVGPGEATLKIHAAPGSLVQGDMLDELARTLDGDDDGDDADEAP